MIKVVCAIIIKEDKLLVAQHNNHPLHQYKWEFPGGKVENYESPKQAIIREIKEELDIEIKATQQLNSVIHDYGNIHIELIPFICKIIRGEITLNQHLNFKWSTIRDLQNIDFSEADKLLIEHPENKNPLLDYTRENLNKGG